MIVYNSRKWLGIFRFLAKSDTIRRLSPYLISIFLFSILVAYLETEVWNLSKSSWVANVPIVHSILAFVLSLILVFRTNTAYDRWWEGRKLWGTLTNISRNLAIKIAVLLPDNDEDNRKFFREAIPLYAETLRHHLQLEQTRFALDENPHPEFENLSNQLHGPNQVAKLIVARIYNLHKNGIINGEELLSLNAEMTEFTNICGACERIKNTPIPYSYNTFIKRFIIFYTISLPFGYVFQLGYYVAPIVTFVLYVIASLELIAEDIEDPFGFDDYDLPMDKMAKNIQVKVAEII